MQAWGFAYKASCIWNKDKIGKGYWFRTKHEFLLVGVRGRFQHQRRVINGIR